MFAVFKRIAVATAVLTTVFASGCAAISPGSVSTQPVPTSERPLNPGSDPLLQEMARESNLG